MSKYTLYGEGYSYLVPLLLCKHSKGRVHSIFQNGFNIKMDESLVFIGNNKNGLLPFGIHLQGADTFKAVSSAKNGETVVWNTAKNSLEFPSFTLSLEKGKRFKNEVTPLKSNQVFETGFDRFCAQLRKMKEPTGLDIDIDAFLIKYAEPDGKSLSGAEPHIIMLMEAVVSRDHDVIDKALRYFLGRGKGLTPSGDDMIVGLLAFDAISDFVSASFYLQLSELIESEPITTDVSREYLLYASRHEFSSTVSDMVNTLAKEDVFNFEKAFKNLLGVGHSSGLDTLFGILIGMLAYKNMNEQKHQN